MLGCWAIGGWFNIQTLSGLLCYFGTSEHTFSPGEAQIVLPNNMWCTWYHIVQPVTVCNMTGFCRIQFAWSLSLEYIIVSLTHPSVNYSLWISTEFLNSFEGNTTVPPFYFCWNIWKSVNQLGRLYQPCEWIFKIFKSLHFALYSVCLLNFEL